MKRLAAVLMLILFIAACGDGATVLGGGVNDTSDIASSTSDTAPSATDTGSNDTSNSCVSSCSATTNTPSDTNTNTDVPSLPPQISNPNSGYFTSGNKIYDESGSEMLLNGISWFGFETANYVLHGLWSRGMDDMLAQMHSLGYNFLRIPYSNDILKPGVMPNSIDFAKNPDLQGKTPLQILDILFEKAAAHGFKIMLDRHRPTSATQSPLWYTSEVSEAKWISDWTMLVSRYSYDDTLIAVDLHNEPNGAASWGTDDLATDWRLAAERAGNAILSANPSVLIVVEGVEKNVRGMPDNYWWGGNLAGVRNYPVRLDIENKVVYSPHDYGPGVFAQAWFSDPTFPNNLPGVWDKFWGYIHKENIAPILVGEFGGKKVDLVSPEGMWQNSLVDYIAANDMYWTYWCWNPNSGDTGGVLNNDWLTIDQAKQDMIDRLLK